MKDDNLPDDCQGSDPRFPWNEPEQEVYVCWHCGEECREDELEEIKTNSASYQSIGDCCIYEYITNGV